MWFICLNVEIIRQKFQRSFLSTFLLKVKNMWENKYIWSILSEYSRLAAGQESAVSYLILVKAWHFRTSYELLLKKFVNLWNAENQIDYKCMVLRCNLIMYM